MLINGQKYKTAPLALRVGTGSGGFSGGQGQQGRARSPQSQVQAQMQALMQFMNQGMQPPQPQQAQAQPMPQPQGRQPSGNDDGEVAYGDLIIPKTSAYVGEVIPVEIRFYFNANYPTQLRDHPDFGGDGFTVMDFSKPTQREQEINGVPYNVVIFQTAITAVKSGPLEIPPAKIDGRIQVPSRGSSQDDFFSGFFGGQGFGSTARDMTISTKPSKIEIKQLPKDGRPDDFSGAIGSSPWTRRPLRKRSRRANPSRWRSRFPVAGTSEPSPLRRCSTRRTGAAIRRMRNSRRARRTRSDTTAKRSSTTPSCPQRRDSHADAGVFLL